MASLTSKVKVSFGCSTSTLTVCAVSSASVVRGPSRGFVLWFC